LRTDPTALAPERLLVFEVRGSIGAFAAAVQRVPGLELIDEEELQADETDKAPVAYLMAPDIRALQNLESLWRRWLRDELIYGETRLSMARLLGGKSSRSFAVSGGGDRQTGFRPAMPIFSLT
jgi:hypothetical protein